MQFKNKMKEDSDAYPDAQDVDRNQDLASVNSITANEHLILQSATPSRSVTPQPDLQMAQNYHTVESLRQY